MTGRFIKPLGWMLAAALTVLLAAGPAAAGGIIYKKAIQQANNKTIPTEWLGSDLSSYYDAGFRPSP